MLTIAWPFLAALLPLPLIVRFLVPAAKPSGGGVVFAPFTADLSEGTSPERPAPKLGSVRLWLAVLAWGLLVAAAVRPQWLGEPIDLPRGGRNLMLAIDVSESMKAVDLAGGRFSRLDVVKAVAGDFILRREGDRIGLILFATAPYLQSPLSFDTKTVATFLEDSRIGVADQIDESGRQISRTAIGDAIGLALKRLRASALKSGEKAVLILLTDGASNWGELDPLKAADLAKQEELKIYTIGVGAGGRDLFGRRRGGPDMDTLKAIADATGGQHFRASDARALVDIYAKLDELEPIETDTETVRPVAELYIWPLGGALVLSLGIAFLGVFRRGTA